MLPTSDASLVFHRLFNWSLNHIELFLNAFGRLSSQVFQRVDCVVFSSFWYVEVRRVRHEVECRDKRNRNNEAEILIDDKTDIRPNAVNVENSSDNPNLHEASQSSAAIVWRNLANVHCLSCHHEAYAEPLKQSRDVNLRHIACENHEKIRENEEDRAAKQRPLATDNISERPSHVRRWQWKVFAMSVIGSYLLKCLQTPNWRGFDLLPFIR